MLHPSLTCTSLGFISNQLQLEFLELFLVDQLRTQFLELLLTDYVFALVSRPSLFTGTDLLRLKELKTNYTASESTNNLFAPLPCTTIKHSQDLHTIKHAITFTNTTLSNISHAVTLLVLAHFPNGPATKSPLCFYEVGRSFFCFVWGGA